MHAALERCHAVKRQPCRAAPHHHIAMRQRPARGGGVALQASKQKNSRQAQREGHDRRCEVASGAAFIAVLVQAHAGTGLVTVDEAGVRREVGKPGFLRGASGQREEAVGHGGPRLA